MNRSITDSDAPGDKFKYWAFISYSHQDKRWGDWLHRALETYRLPRHLHGGRDGDIPRRLMPVFRDREELPSSANLGQVIAEALQQSRTLIVICSPPTPKPHSAVPSSETTEPERNAQVATQS